MAAHILSGAFIKMDAKPSKDIKLILNFPGALPPDWEQSFINIHYLTKRMGCKTYKLNLNSEQKKYEIAYLPDTIWNGDYEIALALNPIEMIVFESPKIGLNFSASCYSN